MLTTDEILDLGDSLRRMSASDSKIVQTMDAIITFREERGLIDQPFEAKDLVSDDFIKAAAA